MIYDLPLPTDPLDQGDLIDDCPVLALAEFDFGNLMDSPVKSSLQRVVVITQTCDLANEKTTAVNVAAVFDAAALVEDKTFKPAEIKGPVRAGRVWGVYFLPASAELGLDEMIVDLRRLHTVRLDLLLALCQAGKRRGRVRPLYREHLAKHFADTFSRIGLPRPYETM